MAYETILFETRGEVGLITLNRPDALNALNAKVLAELQAVLAEAQTDGKIGAIVVTGSAKAFAAGADVKEMQDWEYADAVVDDNLAGWREVSGFRKPMIAAVSGYALGGGCELAMMCDIIIASESAKFGQPEITLGIMPGMGGTQRLARFVGKAKAMDMILTGRQMGAEEAERCGLVSRVVPDNELLEEAIRAGKKIASFSLPSVLLAKEMVNRAYDTTMTEGLEIERRQFQSLFAFSDQKEGMAAFAEKRSPSFKDR
ncbi:MAG: enoyl-CoA hydratase [Pseudomonadota bacterium]